MTFLPPVVMEMRANASQFLSEQGKVIASAKTTATETEKAAQKEAAAARTSAAEATRAAEQKTAAAETSAKAAVVATDRRIAADVKATEAQAKAAQMQAESLGAMTKEQQAAYDKQVAAAERAANSVALAAAKESEAQGKAAAAATVAADAQTKAADLQVVASEKTAAAQEVAATRTKTAMNSVVGVANKVSAASILVAGAVAVGAVEMASKFEKSTMLLVTAGGESMSALAGVRQGILDISTQTGTSAEMASEGMYIMEKAGYRGAAGLAALKASAEGAKDENVDLATMAQATTDVLLDYGYKMDTVANATASSVSVTNMLVAASGAAKTTMTDFAGSMSAVVPIAATAKISFDQIGGAIATMTQHGQSAQQSSQNLANLIMSLVRPNNLASAAMQQLGIDTTDLASHLGERGLYASLQIVNKAIQDHTQNGLVFMGSMKNNKSAVDDMNTALTKMPPALQDAAKGLLTGTTSQKEFTKAAKDTGGAAGAVADQFITLYKSTYGMSDNFKAGKPAAETYAAALRDVLGNVTAMRAAQMLLMNDGHEFEANIKAIGDAGKKTGNDIATWADMQSTLSIQMDQTKNMVANLGIEMGTKLLPVAKDLISGFADLVHGMEKGNPVLWGIATVIGGALVISTVNFTKKLVEMGIVGVKNFIDLGKSAVTMGGQFAAGFGSAEAAADTATGKMGTFGGIVRGSLMPALVGAGTAAAGFAAYVAVMSANTELYVPNAQAMHKALVDIADASDSAAKTMLDSQFSQWDKVMGKSTLSVTDLDGAIKTLKKTDGLSQWLDNLTDGIAKSWGISGSAFGKVQAQFKAMGDQMGQLVQGGQIDIAAKDFDKIALAFTKGGKSAQDALDIMPGYSQSLKDNAAAVGVQLSQQELLDYAMGKVPDSILKALDATQKYTDAAGNVQPITPALQKSLDDAGISADGLATDLDKVISGMESAGLMALSTRDAQFKFADAINQADVKAKELKDSLKGDLSSALDSTGTDFNKTTDAGKAAEEQFSAVTRSGLDQAQSMAKAGASHEDLQKVLTDTYHSMQNTAEEFGLGKTQADALTRSVLGIPPGVDITTWMDDYAKQKAGELTGAVNAIPKDPTIHVHVDMSEVASAQTSLANLSSAARSAMTNVNDANNDPLAAAARRGLQAPGGFTGGSVASIMGMYDGGVIPGTPPSNPNVDNILAMVNGRPLKVRSGEFLNNEPSTKVNLPWLKASNAGLNIGSAMNSRYASGYAQGAAQAASPYSAASPQRPGTVNYITVPVTTNASAPRIAQELGFHLALQG